MFKFSSRVQIIILSVSFSLWLDIYYRRSKRRTELSVRDCDVKCHRITRPAVIMHYYGHICNFLLQTDPQAQITYHSCSRALSLFLFRLESKIFPGAVHVHLESSHTRRTRTIYVELVRLNIFTEKSRRFLQRVWEIHIHREMKARILCLPLDAGKDMLFRHPQFLMKFSMESSQIR